MGVGKSKNFMGYRMRPGLLYDHLFLQFSETFLLIFFIWIVGKLGVDLSSGHL